MVARAEQCEIPATFKKVELNEDDVLISVLRSNGRPVWDGFDLYEVDGSLLIPASLLIDAMSLPWSINIPEATISWDAQTSDTFCTFQLNLSDNTTEKGLMWARDDFDLYIDVALIPSLLPIEYSFDHSLLHLNFSSTALDNHLFTPQKLTIPQYYSRENTIADRVIEDQYQWYTSPLVSYRLTASDTHSQAERTSLNINSSFDFAQHATNLRVSRVNDNSLHFLRFSRDIEALKLGTFAQAIHYEVGDIQLLGDNLITSPGQSLGVIVQNGDTQNRRNFSQTTIEEFVLPGWRVQLFRNGQFIEEKFSDEQNKVLFEEVDTFYGINLFEIKLYGPEGQQETRTQTVSVGNDQIQQGQFDFFFGYSDAHYRLLDGRVSHSGPGQSSIAKLGYGLTDSTTLSASIQRLELDEITSKYFTTSLDTQLLGSAINVSIAKQSERGFAAFVGLSGRLDDNLAFNLSHRYFDDFSSERFSDALGLQHETIARVNGQSSLWGQFGWNVNLSHKAFINKEDQSTAAVSINDNLLGGTFSGGITASANAIDASVLGRLYYSKSFNGWQLASAWTFEPSHALTTDTFYFALRWPYLLGQHRETRLQYRANSAKNIELQHQHNWAFDTFNLGFGATWAEGGDWSVNLTLSGNLHYNPYSRSIDFDRAASATAGRIDAFAFFDINRNKHFDEHEQVIEGVGFEGNSIWRHEFTNHTGVARLITNHPVQSLSITPSTLPDPFMRASDRQVDIVSHSGGVNRVALPVSAVNDVEGTVYLVGHNNSRGAANLLINIVNEHNETVAQTRTENDGYFYISQLPPGEYALSLDETYLARNQLVLNGSQITFSAPESGDVVYLDDIQLILPNHSTTSEQHTMPLKEVKFEIQIGIFRHARSIAEVIRHLPLDSLSIQYYRNHDSAMTYVTVGRFATLGEANAVLAQINTHRAFKHAFVSPITRYIGSQWRMQSVAVDLKERIALSHSALEQSTSKQLCQLSAYYDLSSVNPEILTAHPELLLVADDIKKPNFYRLLAPLGDDNRCTDNYVDSRYRRSPFVVNKSSLNY
ncbi:hypothetical protein D210916BOD24_23470 [Alteromonas sp. D210916BOD_24]